MARPRSVPYNALCFGVVLLLGLFTKAIQASYNVTYVEWVNSAGQIEYLRDDRQPALYTQSFGNCLTDSPVTLTRFDAAYYQDNATVTFHFEGSSILSNETLTCMPYARHRIRLLLIVLVSIGVFAYGQSRFDLVWDPCNTGLTR